MTPRAPNHDDAPLTKAEIQVLIAEALVVYSRDKLEPSVRGLEREDESQSKRMDEVEKQIADWNGSLKVIKWLIIALGVPSFLMLCGLFFDWVKWGIIHNWTW